MTEMNKKHFEIIAEIIRQIPDEEVINTRYIKSYLINHFCRYLKTLNKNFDEEKFKKACERG